MGWLQRRDFATFQNAVDSLGVAAAGDWARLLAPGHADEEKLAAIDALRASLREDGMRSTPSRSEKSRFPRSCRSCVRIVPSFAREQ